MEHLLRMIMAAKSNTAMVVKNAKRSLRAQDFVISTLPTRIQELLNKECCFIKVHTNDVISS